MAWMTVFVCSPMFVCISMVMLNHHYHYLVLVYRFWDKPLSLLPGSKTKRAVTLWHTVERFYERHESDDLLFMFLVLIDAYVTPVSTCLSILHMHVV